MCANCHREIHGSIIPCPTELINNEAAAQEAAKRFEENKIL
uniref:Apocytochrome F n=1 Tax=Podoviridae sp. ct8Lf7 TaxID=2827723 RepID=A0A8S5S244_9CAUD|nr:MAG TPA: apocytochrome F [Podoviridae sp. ct8Lf7]